MKLKVNGSIVIYKNDKKDIDRVVSSFFSSETSFSLYLIDNSPADYAKNWYQSHPDIIYIKSDNNGYGAGHNIALKESIEKCDFHVILNPDVYFGEKEIDKLGVYMFENDNVGLCMPQILYPNGDIQYLCKLLPTPVDWILRRFFSFSKFMKKRNELFELRFTQYNKKMNIPYLSGCFMFFRTSVLKEIGLFDENIFMYAEDTDISRRVHEKYKTLFNPDFKVYHEHQKESHKSLKMMFIHIKATIYYFNKWGWFFDSIRKETNRKILNELDYNH